MLDKLMIGVSKYAISHVYDIHALLAGTIAFVVTLLFRKKLKKHFELLDMIFAIAISLGLYYIFTEASVLIRPNWKYFVLAVVDVLGEVFILRAFLRGRKFIIFSAVVFLISLIIAYYYCLYFISHFKLCYGLKGAMLCFGTLELCFRINRYRKIKRQ